MPHRSPAGEAPAFVTRKGCTVDKFTWSDKLSTGNQMIDHDHQKLFELLDQLHDLMVQNKEKTALSEKLGELIAFTAEHFSHEEALMQKMHYADYTLHKSEHQKLLTEVRGLQQRYEAGSVALSGAAYAYLTDWLNTHILTHDLKLGVSARSR